MLRSLQAALVHHLLLHGVPPCAAQLKYVPHLAGVCANRTPELMHGRAHASPG